MSTIPEKSAAWHAQRARHVGGSEVASLFEDLLIPNGERPFISKFELWHRKAGTIEAENLDGNERIQAGNYLEPAIAKWVADKTGWTLGYGQDVAGYQSNGKGLGGTPDYYIQPRDSQMRDGVLEIKTVDSLAWRDWPGGNPPLKYELQLQAYMGLTRSPWGGIAFLIGGNELKIQQYPFRPRMFEEAERRAVKFWDSIKAGSAPEVTDPADIGLYLKTMKAWGENIVNWNEDEAIAALLEEHLELSSRLKTDEERCKWIKKELADRLAASGARKGFTPRANVTLVEVAPVASGVITPDMVGQPIGGRKGSAYLKITPKKEKP